MNQIKRIFIGYGVLKRHEDWTLELAKRKKRDASYKAMSRSGWKSIIAPWLTEESCKEELKGRAWNAGSSLEMNVGAFWAAPKIFGSCEASKYSVDTRIVRGLDYYARPFSVITDTPNARAHRAAADVTTAWCRGWVDGDSRRGLWHEVLQWC